MPSCYGLSQAPLFGHDYFLPTYAGSYTHHLEASHPPKPFTMPPLAAEHVTTTSDQLATDSQPASSPKKADADAVPNEDEILCKKCGNIAPCCYIGIECCADCWSDEEGKIYSLQ
ncbi:hypothetical protein AAVH_39566 [Aphelenchoides avenae]|nr:hypothetical protein AAVH_39566 [Aphelenchus avenae]